MKKKILMLVAMMFLFMGTVFAKYVPKNVSIGGIAFNSSDSYVRSVYGAPTNIRQNFNHLYGENTVIYSYNDSLLITFVKNKATFLTSKTKNGLKTQQGIAVGDSFEKVLNTYGNPISSFRRDGLECNYFGNNVGYGIGYMFSVLNGKVVKIDAGLFD